MRKSFIGLFLLIQLAGCNRQPLPAVQETGAEENMSVTRWSERTELFLEYPPLVAGATGRFAVHFTDLRTFKPVSDGKVTVELRQDGQTVQAFTAERPSNPGIFGVDVQPNRAGNYSLTVSLDSPGLSDAHPLGTVTVYSSLREIPLPADHAAEAADALPEHDHGETSPRIETADEEAVPFLKEQQWTLDFATEKAAEREITESLRVPGEIGPRSGGELAITAPISGRISSSTSLPIVGQSVSQGEPLASLIPPTPLAGDLPALEVALAEAASELELATRDRERVGRLLEAGAVPAWRLDRARAAETQAAARLKAAQDRLDQYKTTREADVEPGSESLFLLRSPISGVVTEIKGTAGANVERGYTLFRIVAVDRVYVVAHVPEAETHRIAQLTGAEIELPGAELPVSVQRLISVSRWIDPTSRTLSVIYEVDNSAGRLAIGQALPVRLFFSQVSRALAVSEEAIVDDGGRPVIFVQVAGESFVRRPVRLGIRATGYVQILEGVSPGERVVTKGAYLIRLAALSPQIPAHGHVH